MKEIKVYSAVVLGFICTAAEQYIPIITCVILAIVFDVVTGLLKAKATGTKLNSKKGTKGFWKKMGSLTALFFGFFLDYFIPIAIPVVNIPFKLPFGLVIGVYLVLNECISICENLYKINPKLIPKWIAKLLSVAITDLEGENSE